VSLIRSGNSDEIEGLLLFGQQSSHALISERASLQGISKSTDSIATFQQYRSYPVDDGNAKSFGASGVSESSDPTSSQPNNHSALPVPGSFTLDARENEAPLTNGLWFDSVIPLSTSNQDQLPQRLGEVSQADTVSSPVHAPSFVSAPLTPMSANPRMWTHHTVRHQPSMSLEGLYTNLGSDSTATWPVASHDTL
jgi:hypothetical protein